MIERNIVAPSRDAPGSERVARPFLGVYDFRYAPYSVGDAITWQMHVLVAAIEEGAEVIHHALVADPRQPACWMQPHIGRDNYLVALQNIFPAFLCSPLLGSISVFRERGEFNGALGSHLRRGLGVFPRPLDHLRRRVRKCGIVNSSHGGFPISHSALNAFHARHGYLPRLVAPRGYERGARLFLAQHAAGKKLVALHMRQSGRSAHPAALHRDAPLGEWIEFLEIAEARWPDAVFAILGAYQEWERPVMRLRNVVIPRSRGFGLAHELALLHCADMFMGSSSGFSAAATFSAVPYVIVNVEHDFSRYCEVPVGGRRYPFALENQTIHWERETAAVLVDLFEQAYSRLERPAAGSAVPAPAS